jgi:hypothetical protein
MARTKKTLNVQLNGVSVLTTDEGFALDAITEDGRRVLVHMRPIQMMEVQDRIREMARHSWVQDRLWAAYTKLLGRRPAALPYMDKL